MGYFNDNCFHLRCQTSVRLLRLGEKHWEYAYTFGGFTHNILYFIILYYEVFSSHLRCNYERNFGALHFWVCIIENCGEYLHFCCLHYGSSPAITGDAHCFDAVPLVSHITQSAKLRQSLWWSTSCMMSQGRGGRMLENKCIFGQMSPPTFLKLVCQRKGGCTYFQVLTLCMYKYMSSV